MKIQYKISIKFILKRMPRYFYGHAGVNVAERLAELRQEVVNLQQRPEPEPELEPGNDPLANPEDQGAPEQIPEVQQDSRPIGQPQSNENRSNEGPMEMPEIPIQAFWHPNWQGPHPDPPFRRRYQPPNANVEAALNDRHARERDQRILAQLEALR